ncbi:MAG TPA: 6-phosphogluconolactonase, partial [Solirubrobacteraceae bacterium]|nr:6-phosphogluconolactonase [Solirubrobacteraceae bacterium]
MTRICTLADPERVALRAAAEIAQHLARAREARGVAHLALSGGTTPGRTHELLARALPDWEAVEVWFADERCVPPGDERSNHLLARRTLLTPAGIPAERVHRMEGELGPEEGARRYEQELREHVAPEETPEETGAGPPALDVIVLGIGPDGHVASLFPGAATLGAPPGRLCLPVLDSPKPPPERITLSLSVLRAARRCILLATGAAKAEAV